MISNINARIFESKNKKIKKNFNVFKINEKKLNVFKINETLERFEKGSWHSMH